MSPAAIPTTRRARPRAAELARGPRRRNLATFVVVVALLTPLVIASLWVLRERRELDRSNADVVVEVQPGWTPAQVGDELQKTGRDHLVRPSSSRSPASRRYTGFPAGRYVFVSAAPPQEALDTAPRRPAAEIPDTRAAAPARSHHRRRSPNASASSRARARTASSRSSRPESVRSKYEPEDVNSLEGLTWPDTYFVGANETEDQILQKIVAAVRRQGRRGRPRRTARPTAGSRRTRR